jgi:hypothetical protein
MKILHFIILLVVLFLAAMFLAKERFGLNPSAAWVWVMMFVGGTFAAVSGLVLLQRGLAGARLQEVLPMVIPLFAGLMIYQSHWSLALGLAAIVVAWAAVDYLRAKEPKKE